MGKAVRVLAEGGTRWIVGRTLSKLASVQAQLCPENPDLVKTSPVDCSSSESVAEFFAAIPVGSIHHVVVTLGEDAGVSDIRGAAGFDGLRRQFDISSSLR